MLRPSAFILRRERAAVNRLSNRRANVLAVEIKGRERKRSTRRGASHPPGRAYAPTLALLGYLAAVRHVAATIFTDFTVNVFAVFLLASAAAGLSVPAVPVGASVFAHEPVTSTLCPTCSLRSTSVPASISGAAGAPAAAVADSFFFSSVSV